jgi:AcrR family transcriptional regulator
LYACHEVGPHTLFWTGAIQDHRSSRGAAPDRGSGADHRERHRREGRVQRHTYYAHFPELKDLYQACMGHYMEGNPVPDPSRWAQVPEPEERPRVALSEVYAYYSRNEAMLSNVLRDAPLDPVAQETMVSFYQYWETVRDAIADAFGASGEHREALLAAIALALDLQTWRTLVRQQVLSKDRAVELMVGMVRCLMWT